MTTIIELTDNQAMCCAGHYHDPDKIEATLNALVAQDDTLHPDHVLPAIQIWNYLEANGQGITGLPPYTFDRAIVFCQTHYQITDLDLYFGGLAVITEGDFEGVEIVSTF